MSLNTLSTSSLHLSSSWPGQPGCNSSFSFLALRTLAWPRLAWPRLAWRNWAWGVQRPALVARALGEGDLGALAQARAPVWEVRARVRALDQVLACKEK